MITTKYMWLIKTSYSQIGTEQNKKFIKKFGREVPHYNVQYILNGHGHVKYEKVDN